MATTKSVSPRMADAATKQSNAITAISIANRSGRRLRLCSPYHSRRRQGWRKPRWLSSADRDHTHQRHRHRVYVDKPDHDRTDDCSRGSEFSPTARRFSSTTNICCLFNAEPSGELTRFRQQVPRMCNELGCRDLCPGQFLLGYFKPLYRLRFVDRYLAE